MAKTNRDPAFMAAPFLGESSHDPIEFVRRNKTIKDRATQARKERIDENISEGLDKLMIDLKGWEDQEGFKEIMERQDKAMDFYIQLSKKGLDLNSPKTSKEIDAFRELTNYLKETEQTVDEWNRQKGVYDEVINAIKEESTKPKDERSLDEDAMMIKISDAMKGKSIRERKMNLKDLLVFKATFPSLLNKINDAQKSGIYLKPTITENKVYDSKTGETTTEINETLNPDDEKENVRRAGLQFEELDKSYKDLITRIREKDPDPTLSVMGDKEYFATIAVPSYRKRFITRESNSKSEEGDDFLGSKLKIDPAELRTNNLWLGGRNYNNRYEFVTNKKLVNVPTQGMYQNSAQVDAQKGDDGWRPVTGTDFVEAELLFYDPDKDQLVFRTGQASQNPWVANNTTVAVPRANVPDAEKLKVNVNGETKTLKDILPKAGAKKVSSVPEDFWNKRTYTPSSESSKK